MEEYSILLVKSISLQDLEKNFEFIRQVKRIGKAISIDLMKNKLTEKYYLLKKIETELELLPKFYQDVISWGQFQFYEKSKNIQILEYISIDMKKKGKILLK